jgi:hypothetical protein
MEAVPARTAATAGSRDLPQVSALPSTGITASEPAARLTYSAGPVHDVVRGPGAIVTPKEIREVLRPYGINADEPLWHQCR